MKIINPSYEIISPIDGDEILRHLEKAIRVCYKSEGLTSEESHKKIVKLIMDKNHESTLEHHSITVRFVCNRGFTHEMVRHRLASYSQESTRYCNYSKDKFDGEITFIRPATWDIWSTEQRQCWNEAMGSCEILYLKGIEAGLKAQDARGVLLIDVKTEIVVTANLREWRHIFKLRTSKAAHPSMRQLMIPLCEELKNKIPLIFDDILGENCE